MFWALKYSAEKCYFWSVNTTASTIFFGEDGFTVLDQYLSNNEPSKTFVLVDENTSICIPAFAQKLSALEADFEILEIPSGEEILKEDEQKLIESTISEFLFFKETRL